MERATLEADPARRTKRHAWAATALATRPVPRPAARPPGVRSSTTAMRFDPLLPFESWTALGAKIGLHANASSWWLGDWLVFGRDKYGRRYKQAIAVTGLDYQTLRNYAVVARRFAPERRRHDLTFQHHAEVATLPDALQDRWLARAAAGGWSRNELRRHVRAARAGALPGAPPRATLQLPVDAERERRWRAAADAAGCTLEEWVTGALDAASAGAAR